MKPQPVLVPAKPPAKRSGLKAQRSVRRATYYAMGPARTAANKKRKLARHIRRFPEDTQAIAQCTTLYRDAFTNTALSQMTGKAKHRAKLRAREQATRDALRHRLTQPTAPFVAPEAPIYAPFNA